MAIGPQGQDQFGCRRIGQFGEGAGDGDEVDLLPD